MTEDDGVPLSHYRQHKAGVLLICGPCAKSRTLDLEAVILRLIERGHGNAETGIRAVARFVEGPCPHCGARKWETRPDFPPVDNSKR